MNKYNILYITLCLATILSLGGCAEEALNENEASKVVVDTDVALEPTVEVQTRASSEYAAPSEDGFAVGVIGIESKDGSIRLAGKSYSTTYDKANTRWHSSIRVEPGKYYFYAYHPTTLSPDVDATNRKATFSVEGFCDYDLMASCETMGYRENTTPATTPWSITNTLYEVQKENNKVSFKLNHLLAKVKVNFSYGAPYSDLRDIEITSVKLTTANKYTIAYNYVNNTTVYTPTASNVTKTLAKPDAATLDSDHKSFDYTTFYVVPAVLNGDITMVVTYNVYDKKGTCTREAVTATNKLKVATAAKAAESYTLNIKVVPTYLYQLSDGDLDNPTFQLNQ